MSAQDKKMNRELAKLRVICEQVNRNDFCKRSIEATEYWEPKQTSSHFLPTGEHDYSLAPQEETKQVEPARELQVFQVGDRVEIVSSQQGAEFFEQIGVVKVANTVRCVVKILGKTLWFCIDELVLMLAALQVPKQAIATSNVQKQAISELASVSANHPLRANALLLLTNLQTSENLDEEERELIMELSPLVLQWREEARQEGRQEGERVVIENLLKVRFGELDEELAAIALTSPRVTTRGIYPAATAIIS